MSVGSGMVSVGVRVGVDAGAGLAPAAEADDACARALDRSAAARTAWLLPFVGELSFLGGIRRGVAAGLGWLVCRKE